MGSPCVVGVLGVGPLSALLVPARPPTRRSVLGSPLARWFLAPLDSSVCPAMAAPLPPPAVPVLCFLGFFP